ncbi:MAG: hypothetical protein A2089_03730 [Elusimicrobia bacterium GWD2_63_28]|nr:MAG: hypothetical protein A2089_03730 [Elusimicrobia bacterium GWD2_63_28]
MKEFEAFKSGKDSVIAKLLRLKEVISKIEELGLDVKEDLGKIERAVENIKSEVLRIAFVGAFSDGKTSIIAGWLKKIPETMKIDSDESTDSLGIYHLEELGEKCEIIDTPGLYGDKTKAVEGDASTIKYSDITKKYLSEAHLIFYVLDAMNPLKESQRDTVKWLLRDLNKLTTTIFVINKMDAVANLKDADDYERQVKIKSDNLRNKLKEFVGLSESELKKITIVSVSANPGGKGLDSFWFKNEEVYDARSRLDILKSQVQKVLKETSSESLAKKTGEDVVRELVVRKMDLAATELAQSDIKEKELLAGTKNINSDIEIAKEDMASSRKRIFEELNNLETGLISSVRNLNLNEMRDFLESEVGLSSAGEFGYKLKTKIELCFGRALDGAKIVVRQLSEKVTLQLSSTNEYLDGLPRSLINKSATAASVIEKMPINKLKGLVFSGRNMLSKVSETPIKFAPWGATNLAKAISSGASTAAGGLGLAGDLYDVCKKILDQKKTEEVRNEITNKIKDIFRPVYDILSDDERFVKNCAPQIVECEVIVNQQQSELNRMSEHKKQLSQLRKELLEYK